MRNCASAGASCSARTTEEEEALRRSADLLRPLGLELQQADPRGLPRALSGRYQSGFFVPDDGELHPVKWLRGVAAWLMRRGVRIYEHTDVLRIDGHTAVTARGRARCESLVLAVNAHTGGLLPKAARLASPVRAQVLITDPQPRMLYTPVYARHGYEYYRQTRDGRLLVGGWRDLAPDDEVGEDLTLHPRIQAALDAFVRELFPAARVERRWAGIMGFSNDHLPVVRRVADEVAMVLGFSGHGVALAFRLGGLAVQAAQGDPIPGFLSGERRTL